MTCGSCDDEGIELGWYDMTSCLSGDVYGPCEHYACGGLCEYFYRCECECHAADREDTAA